MSDAALGGQDDGLDSGKGGHWCEDAGEYFVEERRCDVAAAVLDYDGGSKGANCADARRVLCDCGSHDEGMYSYYLLGREGCDALAAMPLKKLKVSGCF